MKIVTNLFGPEVRLKEKISLEMASATLRDLLRYLPLKQENPWKQIIKDDLSLERGYVILVNGRNIRSLENLETKIQDGDEITFTVLVSGG
jgi:molybdopterin converting factor small subunit